MMDYINCTVLTNQTSNLRKNLRNFQTTFFLSSADFKDPHKTNSANFETNWNLCLMIIRAQCIWIRVSFSFRQRFLLSFMPRNAKVWFYHTSSRVHKQSYRNLYVLLTYNATGRCESWNIKNVTNTTNGKKNLLHKMMRGI